MKKSGGACNFLDVMTILPMLMTLLRLQTRLGASILLKAAAGGG